MYCRKCGKENAHDSVHCVACGILLTSPAENATPTPKTPPFILDVADEDAANVNIAGKKLKIAMIIKIVALLLCLLFFLPMFTVSCSGMTISFSGADSAFGKTISIYGSSERIAGNIFAIALLLIPAMLFLTFLFKKKFAAINGKRFKVSTVISVLGVVALIIFAIAVNNKISAEGLTPKYTFWYYLSIILYIVAGIASYWCASSVKKQKP